MTSIVKCTRNREYAKISNKLLQNNKLSLKARGIMAYILSLPDTWEICLEHLYGNASEHDGRTAITGALKELREFGYMHLEKITDAGSGRMAGSRWLAYDDPSENPNFTEKQVSRLSDNPLAENPSDGKQATIKETEERKETEKQIPTAAGGSLIEIPPVEFRVTPEQIYEIYPKKTARPTAIKAITRAMKSKAGGELLSITERYALAVKTWPQDQRRFIPNPATWFNQERFNDDPSTWQREGVREKGRADWAD